MNDKTRRNAAWAAAITAGAAIVALAVTVVGGRLSRLLDPEPAERGITDVEIIASDIDWARYDATLGSNARVSAGAGRIYALSTAPGPAPPEPGVALETLYVSDDGSTWDHRTVAGVLGDRVRVSGLAAGHELVYVVGTAPGAAADGVELVVGWSSDTGMTWQSDSLAIPSEPPAGVEVWGSQFRPLVAATAGRVVAAVAVQHRVDVMSLVPANLARGEFGVEQTSDGVKALLWPEGPEMEGGCGWFARMLGRCGVDQPRVVWSATWEELGLDRSPDSTQLFVGAHDGRFRLANRPPQGRMSILKSTGDGFLAVTGEGPSSTVWTSDDGDRWAEAGSLGGFGWILDAGSANGALIVVGQGVDGTPRTVRSVDGGQTWSLVSLDPTQQNAPVHGWIEQASVGPGGAAMVVSTEHPAGFTRNLYVSADGLVWQVEQLPREGYVASLAVGEKLVFVNESIGNGGLLEGAHRVAELSP